MDPYQVLGVEPSWTLEEIEARYRELMLQWHPDLHGQDGAEAVARAEARSREFNQAMSQLREEHPEYGYAAASGRVTGAKRLIDDADWTTGPEGEDYGIRFEWPPPPREDKPPRRIQQCPFCGIEFDELVLFEVHLGMAHAWDYRNARPRKRRRRRKAKYWRAEGFSRSESYLEIAATTISVLLVIFFLWYRSTLSGFARGVLEPVILGAVAVCCIVAFRLLFWRNPRA